LISDFIEKVFKVPIAFWLIMEKSFPINFGKTSFNDFSCIAPELFTET